MWLITPFGRSPFRLFHPSPSLLSGSSIVIPAFHHGARRAFLTLFLASQFSHLLSDSRTDDDVDETHKHKVFMDSLSFLLSSHETLMYMFFRSLCCPIKCKPDLFVALGGCWCSADRQVSRGLQVSPNVSSCCGHQGPDPPNGRLSEHVYCLLSVVCSPFVASQQAGVSK